MSVSEVTNEIASIVANTVTEEDGRLKTARSNYRAFREVKGMVERNNRVGRSVKVSLLQKTGKVRWGVIVEGNNFTSSKRLIQLGQKKNHDERIALLGVDTCKRKGSKYQRRRRRIEIHRTHRVANCIMFYTISQ